MHHITRTVLGNPLTIHADEPDNGPLTIRVTPTDTYTITNPNVSVTLETTKARVNNGTTRLPAEPFHQSMPKSVIDRILHEEDDRKTRAELVYKYMSEHGYNENEIRKYVRVARSHGNGHIDEDTNELVLQRQQTNPATKLTLEYTGNAVRTAGPLEVELEVTRTYEHVSTIGEYEFEDASLTVDESTGEASLSVPVSDTRPRHSRYEA